MTFDSLPPGTNQGLVRICDDCKRWFWKFGTSFEQLAYGWFGWDIWRGTVRCPDCHTKRRTRGDAPLPSSTPLP